MNDTKSKQLEVRVKLEFQDFLMFNYALYYGRFSGLLLNVMGVGALIFLAFEIIPAFNEKGMTAVTGYLPIIILILLLLFLVPAIIFFQSRKIMSNDKFLQSEQRYTFQDDGIGVSSESANTTVRWNQIYKAVSYKHVIALFLSKNRALIIPMRSFNDDDSQLELIKKLKKHVGSKKLKLRK